MESDNRVYPKFNNWESDTQNGNTLVDMRSKHLRYGDITVLKFSDGAKIKFYEASWILDVICEKCSHITKEKYYEKSRDDKQLELVLCIIVVFVGLLYVFGKML